MSTRTRSHSNASSLQPPSYPPSLAHPPTYNPRPHANEQSVLAGAIPPPDGVYTQRSKHFAIALTRQVQNTNENGLEIEDGEDRTPVYGRSGVIQGLIELDLSNGLKLNEVHRVVVKVNMPSNTRDQPYQLYCYRLKESSSSK